MSQTLVNYPVKPQSFYNERVEQVLIGSIMRNADNFDRLPGELSASDFSPRHKPIFEIIAELAGAGNDIDVITVAERMQGSQDEGLGYLSDLSTQAIGANVETYAELILRCSLDRNIRKVGGELVDLSFAKAGPDEKMQLINEKIGSLEQTGDDDNVHVNQIMKLAVATIDRRFRKEESPGLMTGFKDLDEKTMGFQPGDLVILAARPSMGKTALALNIIRRSLVNDASVLFFSAEMTSEKIMMRMLAEAGKINLNVLKSGEFDEEDWPKLEFSARFFKDKKFFINDVTGMHINRCQSIARKLNRKSGLDLIVVDYLQKLRANGSDETHKISAISEGLKDMAKQCGCPVLALSQLNRSVETRPNKRPLMSDLRQSGQIEQDADCVMFIYRDEYYNEDSVEKGIAEIILGKQRDGETGTVRLATRFEYGAFEDLQNYTPPPPPQKPLAGYSKRKGGYK